jgi:hypothetical protein
MIRVCPTCNDKLGVQDKYFCSRCGNALPEDLVLNDAQKGVSHQTISVVRGDSKISEALKKLPKPNVSYLAHFFLGVVLTLVLVAVTYISNKASESVVSFLGKGASVTKDTTKIASGSAPENEAPKKTYTITADEDWPVIKFDAVKFTNYVPYDAYFYVEGANFFDLANLYLAKSPDLEEKYAEILVKYEDVSAPGFAFYIQKIGGKDYYGFLTKQTTQLIQPEDLIFENGGQVLDKKASILAIVSGESMVTDTQNLFAGTEKSLSLNPNFASARNLVPKTGKFFVYAFDKSAKTYLYTLSADKLPEQLMSLVDKFLASKLDFAVIN